MSAGAGSVGVLGAGSWGTALAVHFARSGLAVKLWARRRELAEELARERRNEEFLPGVELPPGVTPTADLEALGKEEIVFVVVPSHGFRSVVRSFLEARPAETPVTLVSGAKGVEAETLARMSRVAFEEAVSGDRTVRYAVLSGPTFAGELAGGQPTAAVVASDTEELAAELCELFSDDSLRLYSSSDVAGVELGGACKNVIAIAAGTVSGLGLGANTLAALITRGLHEITRLGVACGGRPRTFSGLAGLGDLVLTCTDDQSRNRQAGLELARGRTREQIDRRSHMVAEGLRNSVSIARLAVDRGVEMPITAQMVDVVHHGKGPEEAIAELMNRELKAEAEL